MDIDNIQLHYILPLGFRDGLLQALDILLSFFMGQSLTYSLWSYRPVPIKACAWEVSHFQLYMFSAVRLYFQWHDLTKILQQVSQQVSN